MPKRTDVVIRILRKCHVDENGCLIFSGFLNNNGYGQTSDGRERRHVYTHRVMYERFIGPIPEGLSLDHLCRTPACCNPAHLEPVTHRENMLRSQAPSVLAYHANRCVRGHSLHDAYVRKDNGHRMCRECKNVRRRKTSEAVAA